MMEILDALKQKAPITLAGKGRHILLDLPLGQWPMIMENLTFELMTRGITPILAHPERTGPVQQSLDFIVPYLERGVLFQVNTGSLTGKYGPQAKIRAREILSKGWAHFLASDMHRASTRGPYLQGARNLLSELTADYLDEITERNPACVLAGKGLPPKRLNLPQPQPERSGFLAGLFRKRA